MFPSSACSLLCQIRPRRQLILRSELRSFCSVEGNREFVPRLAVKRSTARFLVAAAPLFEEKRGVMFAAGGMDIIDPPAIHRPRLRAGLAADDGPVHSTEVRATHRRQKRLERDEA